MPYGPRLLHLARSGELGEDRGVDDARAELFAKSLFDGLPAPSRAAVLAISELRTFPKKTRLWEEGEPARSFVILGRGRVKLERTRGGRAFPIGHRGPGDTVGETAILAPARATESAIVADDVEALVLAMSALRRLLVSDGDVRAAITKALIDAQRAAEERLAALLLSGVEARIAGLLVRALDRWSAPHAQGELIEASFTHADIALLVGSTRETVTLLLGKLRRDQLIAFDRRRIVVRSRAALERHAAGLGAE